MIEEIISGGQTGADRAALDTAIKLNIPHVGWCPKGRLAELGTTIPKKYSLKETATSKFSERTELNIQDSDGTLILVPELPLPITINDGTKLTEQKAKEKNKPLLIVDLSKNEDIDLIVNWIKINDIKVLNIAGPRESLSPGIYQRSLKFLTNLLPHLIHRHSFRSKL